MSKVARAAISKRTRFEIFKRDEFRCQYCGRKPPMAVLHVDHIEPVKEGGASDPLNYVTACADCNQGKGCIPLERLQRPFSEQVAVERERAEQVAALNAFLVERRQQEEAVLEELGVSWQDRLCRPEERGEYVFSDDQRSSVRTFLRHITAAQILEAMDVAEDRYSSKNQHWMRWKYFCGTCWRKIRRAEGKEV